MSEGVRAFCWWSCRWQYQHGYLSRSLTLESVDGTSPITLSVGDNAAATVQDVQALGFNARTATTLVGGNIQQQGSSLEKTATDDMTINGIQIGQTRTDKTATTLSASDLADAINAVSDQTGVTASAQTVVSFQVNMASATTSSAAAGDKLSVAGVLTADVGANSTVEYCNETYPPCCWYRHRCDFQRQRQHDLRPARTSRSLTMM